MHRTQRTVATIVATLVIAACGGQKSPASSTGSEEAKGKFGVNYYVTVSRPVGGTIQTADRSINCGTLAGANQACGPVSFPWTTAVVLTAVPDAGQYFQNWAGDCGDSTATCRLDTVSYGADKWVVAIFNPPERLGHGNITSPSIHAQKYFDFLGNVEGAPRCTNCHGQTYAGQGIAPSCNACHAAAGWANWQQSCSFCHGKKDAVTKAGYVFADGGPNQEWAAPPDDVKMRLVGTSDGAAGAHQAHVAANAVRSPIACSECHVVPATAIHTLNASLDLPFGPLSKSQGANPTWNAATLTCGSNYCHGSFNYGGVQGKFASLSWGGSLTGCTTCHDMPPLGHAYGGTSSPASCAGCHSDTVLADGTIDLAKGRHINGQKDAAGGACDACHWYPNSLTRPATGAHLAHYGLTAADGGATGFGDVETLEAKFPGASPTEAPAKYAFGCGNCHPMSLAQHSMGSGSTVAKVLLYEAGAPADSLKAKNSSTASYDATAKTCNGVYCHSSGQKVPTFAVSPAWTSTAPLGCGGCHGNPPRYPSGGAFSDTANGHLWLDPGGWVGGHILGLPGELMYSRHGGGSPYNPTADASPMTCETCHYDTTDPASRGPSGFYWLDTTGEYEVGGISPPRCDSCHSAGNSNAPLATGQVLPLRHVNGTRDVVFDPRTALPSSISWLPAVNTPTLPYWFTDSNGSSGPWLPGVVRNGSGSGSTISLGLGAVTYDPANKTCSNVACHVVAGGPPSWGSRPDGGFNSCNLCHDYGGPYVNQ